ncbi:MAG: hypothetical protein K2H49_04830 [Muribaculaceae bacterium]|nr:hypothetical protein [Muribaculaceae bacterium]
MAKRKTSGELPPLDEDQKKYREYFGGITDRYLIAHSYDPDLPDKNGYIIFIDRNYDIDYIDYRDDSDSPDQKQMSRAIAKLQLAEAVPSGHLPDKVRLEFKRSLGAGYIHALNGNFDDIPEIISKAEEYLKKRNREFSRNLFLSSGLPAAIIAFVAGWIMYEHPASDGLKDPWYFGIVFGILGAFVSIWTRYGKVNNSGMGGLWLHFLECVSRISIGVIFAIIAMVAIRCRLILPALQETQELMAFILVSFIAAFSERFIPSVIEKITNNSNEENE